MSFELASILSSHNSLLFQGLPDPPMDVRVDSGPQDGTILVTWIPVTLNVTTSGNKIKTSPITGYAVFADGKRVTDVDSPSSELLKRTIHFTENLTEL